MWEVEMVQNYTHFFQSKPVPPTLFSVLANGCIHPFILFKNLLSNYSILSTVTGMGDKMVNKVGPCLQRQLQCKCLKENPWCDDEFLTFLYQLHCTFSATRHRTSQSSQCTSCISHTCESFSCPPPPPWFRPSVSLFWSFLLVS